MSEWRAKRFWTGVAVARATGGFEVLLDTRPVRTPAQVPLVVPTSALAEAIAREWEAQDDVIDPLSMPMTRSANAAIDKVTPNRAELVTVLTAYAETDLLCHRADRPAALVRLQAEGWDPLLHWAKTSLQAPLTVTTGVIAVDQPPGSLAALKAHVAALDAFALTALDLLVSLSGSLIIGLAVLERVLPVAELWQRSRIDEAWQVSEWGADEEASAVAARKQADFLRAAALHDLSRNPG